MENTQNKFLVTMSIEEFKRQNNVDTITQVRNKEKDTCFMVGINKGVRQPGALGYIAKAEGSFASDSVVSLVQRADNGEQMFVMHRPGQSTNENYEDIATM